MVTQEGKREMGRTLNDIIAELPPDRRASIHARYNELKKDVERLRAAPQIVGKARGEIATAVTPNRGDAEWHVLNNMERGIESEGGEGQHATNDEADRKRDGIG
jgi:hypothetical protein